MYGCVLLLNRAQRRHVALLFFVYAGFCGGAFSFYCELAILVVASLVALVSLLCVAVAILVVACVLAFISPPSVELMAHGQGCMRLVQGWSPSVASTVVIIIMTIQ